MKNKIKNRTKKRIPLGELSKYINKDVYVSGFVNSVRNQKEIQFIIVRDRTGMVQLTNKRKGNQLEELIESLTPESTVEVYGKVIYNPAVKLNQLEIKLYELEITSQAESPLPIHKDSSLEKRLDWRYLDLRNSEKRLIFEIQTTVEQAMREYWLEHGFIEIHSPKLVGGATESGAELFKLNYFGKKASLAQSPQFYKQMAMAAGFEKVFEVGPVFRANPSFTSRHDTEFTSVDMEMSWVNSHKDIMEFEEKWLQHVLNIVYAEHGDRIEKYFGAKVVIPKIPFPRITMSEAYEILQEIGYDIPREKRGDLDSKGEKLLSKHIKDEYGHEFVFVTDYPVESRPFYHMRYDDRPDITKSFDLLWKGLEVTTGAQREHRYTVLYKQALEKGVSPKSIKHYLEFFKYGCPPHGGLGFGLTRMLMILLDMPNVREVTYVYRGPNRLTP